MASLNADGQCALPTGAGLLPIRVANATFEKNLDAVDLTVGGTAADGRYVTYHFNGVMSEGDATTACDALLNPRTL